MRQSRRHILLLEDHRDLRAAFVVLFEKLYDHALHLCSNPSEALGLTARQNVDLALVDLASGSEVRTRLEMIRSWRLDRQAFPVIAMSAYDYEGLAVEALQAGADDFMRKPFVFSELNARVQRLISRRGSHAPSTPRIDGIALPTEPFTFAQATVYPDMRLVFSNGSSVKLSAKHLGMLREFAAHAGKLVLREELTHKVWGADANTNSTSVHQYLYLLRKLYLSGGIDLNAFITPQKAGWRIASEATAMPNTLPS